MTTFLYFQNFIYSGVARLMHVKIEKSGFLFAETEFIKNLRQLPYLFFFFVGTKA